VAPRPGRLAYLGTLAGGLAHEVKNPLSTLLINLGLLREDLAAAAPPEAQGRILKRIGVLEREVKRLDELVQSFLRLARGFDLRPEPTDLNALLREIVEFVEPEARRERISLRCSFAPLPPLRADPSLLRQAVLNLLVNARQAMREGGELLLRTFADGPSAVVEVTDTGTGMAPEVLARCFDAYFSTKKGGTGLGLPTARRIVEEHGGTIEVWSELGRGTRFTLRIPLGGEEAPPS
jgi:signal transduction histidine kinase